MANELRKRQVGIGGLVENNPLLAAGTTLNDDSLAAITGGVTSTEHMPIVLDPDGVDGDPEIALIVALTNGDVSATIVRGSNARDHAQGTPWVHGPILSDVPLNFDTGWGGDLGYDYEFEANSTSLPSGWAWVNQGGATYAEKFGAGAVAVDEAATWQHRSIVRAFPAGTWLATFKLVPTIVDSQKTGASIFYGGVVLQESSSGKFLSFGIDNASGTTPCHLRVVRWSDATTDVAFVGSERISMPLPPYYYLRVRRNSSTSYDFEYSADGRVWVPIVSAADPTANLTPNKIGFGIANANGVLAGIACEWFRVR